MYIGWADYYSSDSTRIVPHYTRQVASAHFSAGKQSNNSTDNRPTTGLPRWLNFRKNALLWSQSLCITATLLYNLQVVSIEGERPLVTGVPSLPSKQLLKKSRVGTLNHSVASCQKYGRSMFGNVNNLRLYYIISLESYIFGGWTPTFARDGCLWILDHPWTTTTTCEY